MTLGCQKKRGQGQSHGLFDAGVVLLFHLLALRVTLMKEFGSLSQKHEKTGSKKKKSIEKKCEVWEKAQIGSGRRLPIEHLLSAQCGQMSGVVQYGSQ